ncbi:MAG: CBS domain-containing protein, partial [Candidatus Omnitrophica bacterium]|nr:CBS domain-containing protein [Candidatus Omnitrophota bacterium]
MNQGFFETKVKEIMTSPAVTVTPETLISEAIHRMAQKDIGIVVVLEDNKIIGVFSERDLVQKIISQGLDPYTLQIREYMTLSPVCVTPETNVAKAFAIMRQNGFRHIPVEYEEG